MNEKIMRIAIREALKGMRKNEGGPFGAVIARGDTIVARAHNRVIMTNDPTAHAEINAIRKACRKLGRFNLSDCVLYTTCEPCPMCFGAVKWAKIRTIFFGSSRRDAARAGFDDELLYDLIKGDRTIKSHVIRQYHLPEHQQLFNEWKEKKDRVLY